MMRRIVTACIVAWLAFTGPAPANAQSAPLSKRCDVPPALADATLSLSYTEKRLKRDKALTIVALGSSSTAGSGGSGPQTAWPAQLEAELGRRFPNMQVSVINKAKMRQSVPEMLARLDSDVIEMHPSLVIWEAGTNEAVRGVEPDTLVSGLLAGVDRLHGAKIDVILMDMQYSRDTARLIKFPPYIEAIRQVGAMRDIYIFPRYDIMRQWVENAQVNFEGQPPSEIVKTADKVYACLAKYLATILETSLKPR